MELFIKYVIQFFTEIRITGGGSLGLTERETPEDFSIPEIETQRPVTLDTATFAETSL